MNSGKPGSTSEFRLDGQWAVVTGAARGIGAAIAVGIAGAGAGVVLIDRPGAPGLAQVAKAVRLRGVDVRVVEFDLSRTNDLADLADDIWRLTGGVHVLVNNAGVAALEHFNEITPQSWHRIMAVNVDAVFFLSQRFAEHMIDAGVHGRVICVSSKNGMVAESGLAHYNASKGAVELIARSLASELGPHHITVNTIAPGMIDTGIAEDFALDGGFVPAWNARIPLGRYGLPVECVGAVLLLASPAGSYISGATIVVDGGVLADQMPRLRHMSPYRSRLEPSGPPV